MLRHWKIALIVATLALLVLGACYGARHLGFMEGIQSYHNQCFYIGGYVVDNEGNVVVCMPQGKVPKPELPNFKSTI